MLKKLLNSNAWQDSFDWRKSERRISLVNMRKDRERKKAELYKPINDTGPWGTFNMHRVFYSVLDSNKINHEELIYVVRTTRRNCSSQRNNELYINYNI